MQQRQRNLIDTSLSAPDRRAESNVTAAGEFSIFARTGFGELLRDAWSSQDPVWRTRFLERVG